MVDKSTPTPTRSRYSKKATFHAGIEARNRKTGRWWTKSTATSTGINKTGRKEIESSVSGGRVNSDTDWGAIPPTKKIVNEETNRWWTKSTPTPNGIDETSRSEMGRERKPPGWWWTSRQRHRLGSIPSPNTRRRRGMESSSRRRDQSMVDRVDSDTGWNQRKRKCKQRREAQQVVAEVDIDTDWAT